MEQILPLFLWGTVLSIGGALFCTLYAQSILTKRKQDNDAFFSAHGDVPNIPKHPRWPREDR